MSRLPDGWAESTVEDLLGAEGVFSDGDWIESKDQDPEGAIRLLQLADIGDGKFINKSSRFVNQETFERLRCTEVFENDVLIARMPDPLGRACLTPPLRQRCITVVDVAILRPGPNSVDPRWLMHFLNAAPIRDTIELQASGTTRKRISRGNLSRLTLPIPPLAEQRRIADKLDELLPRVDACRDRVDRVPGILKRFRQAVIAAATSGELTRDWRDSQGCSQVPFDGPGPWLIPETWRWGTTEDVCEFITKGTTPPKDRMTSGSGEVPYVKVYNLTFDGRLDFTLDPTFVDAKTHQLDLRRSIVLPGDVLWNIVGPPLGKVSIVPDTYPEWNINQAIARFRPKTGLSSGYLALCMMDQRTIENAARQAKATAGQFNLTLEICRAVPLPLPPADEQAEILRRVREAFDLLSSLEQRLARVTGATEMLTQAILTKAFRGELVPQDPNEEPASELLDRIRAERTASGAAPKKRGRSPKVAISAEV